MKKKGKKMANRVIKIEIPIEAQDKTDPELGNIKNKLEELDAAAKKSQRRMDSASRSVSGFEKSLGKGMDNMSKKASGFEKSLSSMEKHKWQILMEAKDKVTPTVKQAISYVKSLTSKTWKVTLKAFDLVTSPVKRVFGLLQSPLIAAGVTISAGAGISNVVQTYAEFEAAMSQVKAISGATGEDFDKLTAKAKQMGATTKFTAAEAAEGFNYMAMAGWKTQDMLGGIEGIMSLAAASGESLGTTSDIVTDALTAFGLKASDSGHFADVLAQAAASANTNVGLMGETFKYVGTMAGSLGYSIEDVSLAAGLMANAGLKGSMAGTALNTMLTRLSTNTSGATDAIRNLGVEFFNSDGTARNLSDIMGELRKATAGMTAEQKANLANTVAGMEAQKGLLAILNASEEDYNSLSKAINNADGAAKRMSDTMLDNLSGKWTLFKSALDGIKIALAEKMEPYLMKGLEWITARMPDIENALLSGAKRIENFVSGTKNKISELTGTKEWQNADFFGKMKIGWDGLIADPFAEWWNSSGKMKLASVAKDVGLGLGTGISAGILTLLGIDVSSTIDEGVSIGKQFASGFAEGFQGLDIMGALGGKLTGAFSNASKLLPGGKAPDLTSWLSAAMLAKIGVPLFKLGSGAFKMSKAISPIIGGTGNAMVGGSGILGTFANIGYGLTGGSKTAGMYFGNMAGAMSGSTAALLGAGATAGGVVGGLALLSAGADAYHAIKSKNKEEKKAYSSAAGITAGGVAAGAAIGTMILPGAGTLIGAGIGGIAGWLGGKKIKNDYEEATEAAEVLKQKSQYAMEDAKFRTKELGEAFKDTNVSVSEFAEMMQEATTNKIKDSFGDIKLSVQEIEEAAKHIVLGENEQSISQFAGAVNQAKQSFVNLQSSVSALDKLNWKASLGMKMDGTDIQEYMEGIEGLLGNSVAYLEDKHYEAKAAIDLLVEPGNETDMFTGLNTMYTDMQSKIESLGGELKAKVNVALEDGVITLDEQAEISNLQNQIMEITSQISEAETEASFQSLKIKYSGASLDADSFASLISEVQTKVQETAESYDEALQISLTNLNLQLKNGAITQEQFDEQFVALTEGYEAKITNLAVRVESFELQSIADSFGSELDGILPDLEGTVAERLGQAMHDAMANGVDATAWSASGEGLASAVESLGLDGLEASTQSAVAELMGQLARSLPEQLSSALSGADINMGDSINSMLTSSVENTDLSGTSEVIAGKLGEGLSSIDMSESGTGLQEGIQNSITASMENIDFSGTVDSLNSSLAETFSGIEEVDMSGFASSIQSNINSSVEGMDYSGVTSAVGNGISNALLASMGEIQSAISNLYSQVGAAINSAFAAGFQTTTTVTITVNYKLANPSATINFSGGGSGTATVSASISGHAAGGYVGHKQLSWLAEEGYGEFVIPTNPSRRGRAIELYEQAGRMLGVGAHAAGGFVGRPVYNAYSALSREDGNNIDDAIKKAETRNYEFSEGDSEYVPYPGEIPIKTSEEASGKDTNVEVKVQLNPTFQINGSGGNEENVLRIIRLHLKELADEIGSELSDRVEEVFSNMPIKA